MSQDELPLDRIARSLSVVRLTLDERQTKQLAPLAIETGLKGQNVLFVASVVPFWRPGADEAVWELQVVRIPARSGSKIAKLIREVICSDEYRE